MDKKIIFFDIDGTIITEESHHLPQSTIDAIKKARDNGHLTFINTGRTFFNVEEQIRDIGFDGYVCGCGTYIHYLDAPLLYHSIPHNKGIEIVKILKDCKINAILEGLNDIYFDYSRPLYPTIANLRDEFVSRGYKANKTWDDPQLNFDKFVVWINEDCDFERFHQYITKDFEYIDRGNNFGEIVPKGYSKATGIQFLLDYFSIPLEHCYAIGDSTNDLAMLEYVPNSIAMGNSDDILYDKVSYVTKKVEDHGIWTALKHYNII